jgi:short-subunit dehydrogenase
MTDAVLITGATKGIGRATARRFAEAGYDLIAVARTPTDLAAMQEEWLQAYPGRILRPVAADLAEATGRSRLEQQLATLPPPAVVVCNAGRYSALPLLKAPDELPDMLALNFWAPYYLARYLLPQMIERGSGHWITVGSVATRDDTAGIGQYAVSKYAVEGLHRSLAHELRATGLHTTLVIPGATYTASWQDEDRIPERILAPEQVAEAIFAASRNPQTHEVMIRP